jgi:hypothetical protein
MTFDTADKEAPVATKNEAPVTVITPVEVVNDKAVAVASSNPPAIYVENEDAEGEFSARDVIWPSLSLVTKTSSDAETYGIGTWLVNKETPVGKMDKPLKLIAVKIQKAYQEQVPFGSGVRPRMFRTMSEVAAAGLSLEWSSDSRAAEVLGVRFWLPQPEGVDAPHVFNLEGPEGLGTIVKFFAARTTYGTVGKTLIGAQQTFLRKDKGGLASGWWEMTATKEAKNGNTWLLPRLRPAGKVDEKLSAFIRDLGV